MNAFECPRLHAQLVLKLSLPTPELGWATTFLSERVPTRGSKDVLELADKKKSLEEAAGGSSASRLGANERFVVRRMLTEMDNTFKVRSSSAIPPATHTRARARALLEKKLRFVDY